ncbi:2240_t:CDS:2 [Scutellospora calospora]|uniref:2240_t:CDS:1 n=1 Tax=Scutellospora calospora TaxID=85575 RepID=A0ACA9JVQ0_9GLOM|nr:2240_t:CDS:2 [Scutellospora calospora]
MKQQYQKKKQKPSTSTNDATKENSTIVIDVYKRERKILLKAPIAAYLEEKELVSNFRLLQEVRVEIVANSLESAIIYKSISNSLIKQNLLELSKKLKDEIYTDEVIAANSKRENMM